MKRLVKKIAMVACVGLMMGLVGCGADTSSPDSVAQEVVSCVKSTDIEGALKYATGDFKSSMSMLQAMMKDGDPKDIAKLKKDLANSKYEVGKAVVNGDKATVPVKIDGKDMPIKLVKEGNAWKVEEFNFKGM